MHNKFKAIGCIIYAMHKIEEIILAQEVDPNEYDNTIASEFQKSYLALIEEKDNNDKNHTRTNIGRTVLLNDLFVNHTLCIGGIPNYNLEAAIIARYPDSNYKFTAESTLRLATELYQEIIITLYQNQLFSTKANILIDSILLVDDLSELYQYFNEHNPQASIPASLFALINQTSAYGFGSFLPSYLKNAKDNYIRLAGLKAELTDFQIYLEAAFAHAPFQTMLLESILYANPINYLDSIGQASRHSVIKAIKLNDTIRTVILEAFNFKLLNEDERNHARTYSNKWQEIVNYKSKIDLKIKTILLENGINLTDLDSKLKALKSL